MKKVAIGLAVALAAGWAGNAYAEAPEADLMKRIVDCYDETGKQADRLALASDAERDALILDAEQYLKSVALPIAELASQSPNEEIQERGRRCAQAVDETLNHYARHA